MHMHMKSIAFITFPTYYGQCNPHGSLICIWMVELCTWLKMIGLNLSKLKSALSSCTERIPSDLIENESIVRIERNELWKTEGHCVCYNILSFYICMWCTTNIHMIWLDDLDSRLQLHSFDNHIKGSAYWNPATDKDMFLILVHENKIV